MKNPTMSSKKKKLIESIEKIKDLLLSHKEENNQRGILVNRKVLDRLIKELEKMGGYSPPMNIK